MNKRLFGKMPDGTEINIYTLENKAATLELMELGAAIYSFRPFGRDIIGGFDTIEGYLSDCSNQGLSIGRVANRIGNASFTLDGKVYNLLKNDGENCLHGGDGYGHKVWQVVECDESSIRFRYDSFDGEEGFPNSLTAYVTYTLIDSLVHIKYEATPDGKTPINLTNHSYFNLDGFGGKITDHTAVIYADRYTEVDGQLIPNGNRPSVKGTVFDFNEPHKIGERIGGDFVGYDHNYMLAPTSFESFLGQKLGLCAEVWNADLKMSVYTDQEGVQFYIGNFLADAPTLRGGVKAIQHGGFCLETQYEPDAPNRNEAIYNKGEHYSSTTVYKIEKI